MAPKHVRMLVAVTWTLYWTQYDRRPNNNWRTYSTLGWTVLSSVAKSTTSSDKTPQIWNTVNSCRAKYWTHCPTVRTSNDSTVTLARRTSRWMTKAPLIKLPALLTAFQMCHTETWFGRTKSYSDNWCRNPISRWSDWDSDSNHCLMSNTDLNACNASQWTYNKSARGSNVR